MSQQNISALNTAFTRINFDDTTSDLDVSEDNLNTSRQHSLQFGDYFEELNFDAIFSNNYCSHATKSHLLQLARENHRTGNINDSIYYETTALGLSADYKYVNNNDLKHVDQEKIRQYFHAGSDMPHESKLLKYVREQRLNEDDNKLIFDEIPVIHRPMFTSPNVGLKLIVDECKNFPTEWTVIQLIKRYNYNQYFECIDQHFSSNLPLSITLFNYTRSDLLNHNPINIELYRSDINLYEIFYNYSKMLGNLYKTAQTNISSQREQSAQNALLDLTKFIGPWFILFIGKANSVEQKTFEETLFKKVDTFCNNEYNPTQKVLMSLIVRSLDLLNSQHISEIVSYILSIGSEIGTVNSIMNFLKTMRREHSKRKTKPKYNPCILIVDEAVNYIPWEMIHPSQEYTRVGSMPVLVNLYEKYKKQIKCGYVMKTIQNGKCIINPDDNLENMEKRLTDFFKNWLPNWNCFAREGLSTEKLEQTMQNTDVFFYAGHGSGFHNNVNTRSILKLNIDSVLFFYGCESLAFKAASVQSEKKGAHQFVEMSLCPAAVGSLTIITDHWTDLGATYLLSSWIPKNSKNGWNPTNNSNWKSTYPLNLIPSAEQDPSLLANIARFRTIETITPSFRMTMICRGLPVVRSNV